MVHASRELLLTFSRQLQSNETLLKITTLNAGRPCFYVQKTLLSGVSEKLVSSLYTVSGTTYMDCGTYDVLKTFLGWLVSRRVEGGTQMSLVEAWRFGARYSMSAFQNDLMRRLVEILHSSPVDPYAVRVAYYTMQYSVPHTIDTREVLKLLRQALVVQIAHQASKRSEHTIDRNDFGKRKLMTVAEFQEDLSHAVCIGFYDEDPDMPGVQLEKHLVEE